MSAAFEIADNPELLAREIQRFLDSVEAISTRRCPTPHRVQNRLTESLAAHRGILRQHP